MKFTYFLTILVLSTSCSNQFVYDSPMQYQSQVRSVNSVLYIDENSDFTRFFNIQIIPAIDNNVTKYLIFRKIEISGDYLSDSNIPISGIKESDFFTLQSSIDSMISAFSSPRKGKLINYVFKSGSNKEYLSNSESISPEYVDLEIIFSLGNENFSCKIVQSKTLIATITNKPDMERFRFAIKKAINRLN